MRVIAGLYRGRTLRAPPGVRTRPTTDRVREAVFSVLGDVTDARVLDLYAGSGALGIEALSRGAGHAVFVETWSRAAALIADNLRCLGETDRGVVVTAPVERATRLIRRHAPFDLVLCDPPWPDLARAARATSRLLGAPGLLSRDARLVFEHPADEPFELGVVAPVVLQERRRWGDTGVSFFAYDEELGAAPPPAGPERAL
jgi:16S rRNA (guanine966-N2)-methyltransferase